MVLRDRAFRRVLHRGRAPAGPGCDIISGMFLAKATHYFPWRDSLRRSIRLSRTDIISSGGCPKLWVCLLFVVSLVHMPRVLAGEEWIRLHETGRAEWTLDVKRAPLAEIFKALTEKMGVPIVSAQPPDGPLTLRCSGPDVQAILSCLLGSGASVMYRRGLPGSPEAIASIRILGSSFARTPAKTVNTDPGRVAAILEMTRSDDPDTRADGLTRLSQLGSGNAAIQRSAFQQGLSDSHGEVRAAALLGLHGVDPEGSRGEMMQGLKDGDANVRLAALDIVGEGTGSEAVLKQALNDPDELVRELARMRLGLPEDNSNP